LSNVRIELQCLAANSQCPARFYTKNVQARLIIPLPDNENSFAASELEAFSIRADRVMIIKIYVNSML
jgi:hypothetical protein